MFSGSGFRVATLLLRAPFSDFRVWGLGLRLFGFRVAGLLMVRIFSGDDPAMSEALLFGNPQCMLWGSVYQQKPGYL